ncbi:MAG: site-2 protease family protein, partial [Thermoanaerobaculia bacterium]
MKGSWRLGSVAGIDLKLHATFPLILLLGAAQWMSPHGLPGAAFGALLMLALFACVALHELGHALAARGFGIPVREIVLLPIGGVAVLGRNPRRPLHELLIAVAGPLVNVAIAAGLVLALGLDGSFDPMELFRASSERLSTATFLHWLLVANVSLVAF